MKTRYSYANLLGRKTLYYSVILLLSIICFSCSDDDGDLMISLDGPVLSVSDFTGNWAATTAVFESTDGSQRLEVVEQGGSATLVVQANGRFTITISFPGQGSEIFAGELGFNGEEYGDRLIVIFDGDDPEDYELFNIQLNNGVLFLNGITTFDFLGNGTEVPATIDLILERG
ncbi:hypothetical protein GTQ34_15515 [Muricauda sp. JGD-17]|uniref:Lipocalin-like domain-containing protein n=1 Tax=Flagellimonas ochracea TaxID=2696472 RepID=A0A964TFJ0_9FLAO|nr:hypothetical protein [Allomuricauda ochracea]NAY93318.1 hypothetical protein [Allomuricauda ochracea]